MSTENNNENLLTMKHTTFFTTMKHQFPYSENAKIDTENFLGASKEIIRLVEQLGRIFAPVRYDMLSNVEKIYSVYEQDKDKHKFLQDLLLYEKEEQCNTATNALQWLRRALHFLLKFFDLIIESHRKDDISDNLERFLKISYTQTLMPYHRWFTQQLFQILCRMCLTREQFFKILTVNKNICDEIIINDMENFNTNLRTCVAELTSFYILHNLENIDRV